MQDKRPNILIITTDQQRRDTLSCYGSSFTSTPNLDRLAAEGVRENRAYCTNPVCTPSRVSLLTGQYPSRHGAWNVGVNYPENEFMVSHTFQEHGYQTHYVGKAHFQAFLADATQSREGHVAFKQGYGDWQGPYYGFETVELAPGHSNYGMSGHYGAWIRGQAGNDTVNSWEQITSQSKLNFGAQAYDSAMPVQYHNSVWTADRTIAFLRERNAEQPFFLAVGFQDPHHPHAVPTDFQDRVSPDAVPLPDYQPGELEDKPPFFREAHQGLLDHSEVRGTYPMAGQGSGFDYDRIPEPDIRLGRAYYYTLVRLIDQEVGRILAALDEMQLAENTLVIFTSDHGELLGDHGLWLKGPFHYEPLICVPLLMRLPSRIPAGQVTSELFSLADIAPTCLAAAGISDPEGMDGVNQLPMLEGKAKSLHQEVLVEFFDDPHGVRCKTIVTNDLKLTWYQGQTYGELYDLAADPHERTNCWDNPEYAQHKARLLSRLLNYESRLEHRWQRYAYA